MKRFLVSVLIALLLISCSNSKKNSVYPEVSQLISRVVPSIADKFSIDSISSDKGKEVFEISSDGDKIVLSGSSPVAVASALNWYLKYYCHCQISQAGTNLNLPEELPVVPKKVRIVSPYKYRYFLNYCTYNYTMSFWSWEQWQKELDWMAMQGINLVLSVNGTEEVWQNTLRKLNYSEQEISDFISGPGYQAWWLMGNLEGWGGPVSQKWIKNRTTLQKNILSYMRKMGMEPIFQGFYGMVPTTLKSKYPKADIRSTGNWCGYKRPDVIMPTDSMFNFFAKTYYTELESLYGKANFYAGDPFHEGKILDVDLKTCGSNIQKAMQVASPGSTWVLQGWIENPDKRLLEGVDKNKTLIIDLYNETNKAWKLSKGFSGCKWLFCSINNFGGRTALYGKIDSLTINLDEARKSEYASQLEGIGVIPEATKVNPFIFEYVFELAWRDKLPNSIEWAKQYPTFRYGKDVPQMANAWALLAKTIYSIPMHFDEPQNVVCARPSLKWVKSAPWGFGTIRYKQEDLKKACSEFLACADSFKQSDTYQYDAVDIVHQFLLGEAETMYYKLVKAYNSKNKKDFEIVSSQFITLINDLDALMSTRSEFLLGNWIRDARNSAPSDSEKNLFEQNARMLITTWGYDKAQNILNDYAHREWSGLISSYYLLRWQIYINWMKSNLNGNKTTEPDFAKIEKEWTLQTTKFQTQPTPNAIDIAVKYFKLYSAQSKQ